MTALVLLVCFVVGWSLVLGWIRALIYWKLANDRLVSLQELRRELDHLQGEVYAQQREIDGLADYINNGHGCRKQGG